MPLTSSALMRTQFLLSNENEECERTHVKLVANVSVKPCLSWACDGMARGSTTL